MKGLCRGTASAKYDIRKKSITMRKRNKKYWVGVVSKEHIWPGVKGGFLQLNHGKKAPLTRFRSGDGIVIYSPRISYPDGEILQKFTAAGFVKRDRIYQVELSDDFKPYRIDIDYIGCHEASIRPLIEKLGFIKNKKNWGSAFRFGSLEIPEDDFKTVINAMNGVFPE